MGQMKNLQIDRDNLDLDCEQYERDNQESYFDEDKGIVLSEEVKEIFKECEEKMPF